MLWNKKRLQDVQVYKYKGHCEFLITYGKPYLTNCAMIEMFAGLFEEAKPNYQNFCHTQGSLDWLYENCYPVSQKKLAKFQDWYKFFNHYLTKYMQ